MTESNISVAQRGSVRNYTKNDKEVFLATKTLDRLAAICHLDVHNEWC